jgi:hypothetical protein
MAYATPLTTPKLLLLMALCDLSAIFCWMQQQTQYLHQFVLHASLDAVDEAMWSSKELHLKVSSSAGKQCSRVRQCAASQCNPACRSSNAGSTAHLQTYMLQFVQVQQAHNIAKLAICENADATQLLLCSSVVQCHG